ncbi:MAG: phage holin family protein [Ruminococcus sp.]|nr:phage holin family protein [Ruminococcus sp.]
MKETICTALGALGSVIAGFFGGWDASIITLIVFMGIDYITGLIVAAEKRSPKSSSGGLNSSAGFRGLMKKGVILLLVLVGARLDIILGFTYIRDGVCIAYIINELISITENAGLLGVPLPAALTNAIEILQKKTEGKDE